MRLQTVLVLLAGRQTRRFCGHFRLSITWQYLELYAHSLEAPSDRLSEEEEKGFLW